MKHSLCGVLSLLALAAVLLFRDELLFPFSAAAHFQRHADFASLRTVLQNEIQNGDTVEKVESLLGSATRNQDAKYRAFSKQVAERNPRSCPDGFLDTDELLGYSTKTQTIHLQARAGRLVNFNRSDYSMTYAPVGN